MRQALTESINRQHVGIRITNATTVEFHMYSRPTIHTSKNFFVVDLQYPLVDLECFT